MNDKWNIISVLFTILILLTGTSTSVGAKECLTVFMGNDQAQYYADGIEEFRRTYPEVDLTVETYSLNELMFSQQKIKTEIMAGKGPDLLLLDAFGTDDVYKMLKAEVFAPLNEFMTAENGWQEELYIDSVMEAGKFMETQYVIPLNYAVALVVSSREALEEIGFRTEVCQDIHSLLQETASLYDREHTKRILTGAAGFALFPQYMDGAFPDYESESIGIDMQKLHEACDAYKILFEEDNRDSMGENGYYGYGLDIVHREGYLTVQTGMNTCLMTSAAIASAETPVIFPLGNTEHGAVARIAQYAGIRANSENRQDAWNMLQILLGEAMQRAAAEKSNSIPVLNTILDEVLEERLQTVLKDAEASRIPANRPSDSFLEEYAACLRAPGKAIFFNSVCSNTFYTMMQPFYNGTASYETCMKQFEEYIKIYLSE